MIFDVSEGDFETRVVERSRELPVIVDFWAAWCGPCRVLGPALEEAVRAQQGRVELAKVDVDSNQLLAQSFGVSGIPAVKAFRDGRVVEEFTGAIPRPAIDRFVEGLLPSPADELVRAGDEESLRRALEADPRHAAAAQALGRILVARGELDEAAELLAAHEGDFVAAGLLARIRLQQLSDVDGISPETVNAAFSAWDEDRPEEALEHLQQAMGEAHDDEIRDLIRRVMVAIFTELGSDHPVAREHRRRLAAALN